MLNPCQDFSLEQSLHPSTDQEERTQELVDCIDQVDARQLKGEIYQTIFFKYVDKAHGLN